jgi:hypothetical protein
MYPEQAVMGCGRAQNCIGFAEAAESLLESL